MKDIVRDLPIGAPRSARGDRRCRSLALQPGASPRKSGTPSLLMAGTPRAERRMTAMRPNSFGCRFLAMTLSYFSCDADYSTANTALPNSPTNASPVEPQTMKVRLKVEDKVMTATLSDSE